jgi:hypothetical protein
MNKGVSFSIHYKTQYGEQLRLVGLSDSDVIVEQNMKWNEGHTWTVELLLPLDSVFQFAFEVFDDRFKGAVTRRENLSSGVPRRTILIASDTTSDTISSSWDHDQFYKPKLFSV